MSGLKNLNRRVGYLGGKTEGRMQAGKLRSLKYALDRSYQAATAILEDGREFKCLINPDTLNVDYDNKILSIPYENTCLTSGQIESTNMSSGQTFTWKETDTHWIIYLERLEEDAYFRAEIRECAEEIEVNGEKYWAYVKGPNENHIRWNEDSGAIWNDLNFSLVLYVTNNEHTRGALERFSQLKMHGQNWEVQIVNEYSLKGVLIVYIKENFNNTIQDAIDANEKPKIESAIKGSYYIKPYDIVSYTIDDFSDNGIWKIDTNKAKIIKQTNSSVDIEVITGRSGKFDLIYKQADLDDIVVTITIESL